MIDKVTSHLQVGLGRVLEQYKDLPNIQSILEVYSEQIQDIENILFDMFTNRALANAVGKQLDYIGDLVGISRTSLDDDTYRLFILFKIGVNRSDATIESILQLFVLISGSTSVEIQNEGGGSISITYSTSSTPFFQDFIEDQMPNIVAAGVKISAFIVNDGDIAFAFAGDIDGGLGFGGLSDATAGGQFASIV